MIVSAKIGLYLADRLVRGNFAILILILLTEPQLDTLLLPSSASGIWANWSSLLSVQSQSLQKRGNRGRVVRIFHGLTKREWSIGRHFFGGAVDSYTLRYCRPRDPDPLACIHQDQLSQNTKIRVLQKGLVAAIRQ